ncbi:MAG: Rid family hydrolase [SAR324 cluster bacterium]|nr:Rid family hydrolase [SAR324 cluster bacterium]
MDEKEETSTFFQLENDLILMTIEFLNPEEAPAPAGSYSNLAILPPGKRILVIAGQIGNLIDGSMVDGLEAQYEQTLKNIHAMVTSQGGSKHDIARITVFLLKNLLIGQKSKMLMKIPESTPACKNLDLRI